METVRDCEGEKSTGSAVLHFHPNLWRVAEGGGKKNALTGDWDLDGGGGGAFMATYLFHEKGNPGKDLPESHVCEKRNSYGEEK